jgi:hypothetical protein
MVKFILTVLDGFLHIIKSHLQISQNSCRY